MKRIIVYLSLVTGGMQQSNAQGIPVITSWVMNIGGAYGIVDGHSDTIESNVLKDQFDSNYVYITCNCIPGYDIGPWNSNPNWAKNQNFCFKITRNPVKNTGTPVTAGLGQIGVWSNGVSIFNAWDGFSYNNLGYWDRNALVYEGVSFDTCLGHPAQNGQYHNHVNPKCLYNDADSTHHSPIIGWAFDGFPVYGAYGYVNADGTGGIKRMVSSYVTRKMVNRDTLPNSTTALPVADDGPPVSPTYPIGNFLQDYIYDTGYGDLDEHNGRFCVTPDYPGGIYAYFVTIDSKLNPVYPFVIGPTYYGTVPAGNTGPSGGHVTITDSTKVWTLVNEVNKTIKFEVDPNPTSTMAYIYFDPVCDNNMVGRLYSEKGQLLKTLPNLQPTMSYGVDMSCYPAGIYFFRVQTSNTEAVQKIIKVN
ncbi:MAG: YHYH protein [Bacteroidia bacterium]